MHKSAPFARSMALMTAMQALIGQGMSAMMAAAASGADSYQSRGKGKGRMSRSYRTPNSKVYPFSSAKQHAKSDAQHYMVTVNGFRIMQTAPAGQRGFIRDIL